MYGDCLCSAHTSLSIAGARFGWYWYPYLPLHIFKLSSLSWTLPLARDSWTFSCYPINDGAFTVVPPWLEECWHFQLLQCWWCSPLSTVPAFIRSSRLSSKISQQQIWPVLKRNNTRVYAWNDKKRGYFDYINWYKLHVPYLSNIERNVFSSNHDKKLTTHLFGFQCCEQIHSSIQWFTKVKHVFEIQIVKEGKKEKWIKLIKFGHRVWINILLLSLNYTRYYHFI